MFTTVQTHHRKVYNSDPLCLPQCRLTTERYITLTHYVYHSADSPQKGIPWGDQVPLLPHTLLAGPSSSKPLSQLYSAMVPSLTWR